MVDELPFPESSFRVLDADPARDAVAGAISLADPQGRRIAEVFRATFDQLYDGQRTGRFRWDQLFKTEKTHYGTLFEINLRRELRDLIEDGDHLDYRIAGHEVDCKYSQSRGLWMLPPECVGHLLLVAHASDQGGVWSLGVVRAEGRNLGVGTNRDGKRTLNARGRAQVAWIRLEAPLPPNILISLDGEVLDAIFAGRSGQARVTELLRRVTNRRIGRNTIATVAQQADYMARVRDNGNGARATLRPEGYLIPGGDYVAHRNIAIRLGVEPPEPGEVVSIRVVPTAENEPWAIQLDGRWWRSAREGESSPGPAPLLPRIPRRAPER